ncbi:elongator complex protein 2 [Diutina catenulata]
MITSLGTFIGANRQSQVFDYDGKQLVYGAGTTLALWDPLSTQGVTQTLKHHSGVVTAVRYMGTTMISASEDTSVVLWDDLKPSKILTEHSKSVTVLSVSPDHDFFISGGSDKRLVIFDTQGNVLSELSIDLYPLAIAIQPVGGDQIVVAVGGTKHEVYIYSGTPKDLKMVQKLRGHEDWVNSLAFTSVECPDSEYVLASGSKDRYIRLWRLRVDEAVVEEDDSQLVLLSNKQYKFSLGANATTRPAAFTFDALLVGHDDWVAGLQWHPAKPQLLSASADTALMIWESDPSSGIWVPVHRLGELSIKGASTATGSAGGFWSCLWVMGPDMETEHVVASGKTGSIRLYRKFGEDATFTPLPGVTGATQEVTDVQWSPRGDYVFATSLDQTTRLYAPWQGRYHEFGRPQIHGYDMICLDNLSDDGSVFVSGGDEKVLRIFQMTRSMGQLVSRECGLAPFGDDLPEAASLPMLGLSNKASNEPQEEDEEDVDVLGSVEGPPLEDILQRYTLYPELEKLYGHGYEITCVATNPSRTLIASACRSNSAAHAVVRVFNVAKDYQLSPQILTGHSLTITSLAWNPAGTLLLAVSRDRQFSVWKLSNESEAQFELVTLQEKPHSRIIWDGKWLDNERFITASRDKSIKVWSAQEPSQPLATLKLDSPVTAVDTKASQVVVGLESGAIHIVSSEDGLSIKETFPSEETPAGRVNRVKFAPGDGDKMMVAAGSTDQSLRVWQITV